MRATNTIKIKTIATIGALVCTTAFTSACGGGDVPANAAVSTSADEVAVIPVAGTAAIKREVPTVVRATGTFTADESSDVAPQVPGQVVKTLVNVGDRINADQPLVQLDDRDARLRLDQARASLERAEADAVNAKANASRSGELYEKGFTPRSDFERLATQDTGAVASVAQARAQLASAQKAVDDTIVRAPFAGHVTARPVAAGEYVTPASKIATIVRIQPIKLELLVKEVDAVKVRRGLPVQAEVSGYPGVVFVGSVSALNVAIDPNSRAMTVEATFPNADGTGDTGDVRQRADPIARDRSGRVCASRGGAEDRQRRRDVRDRRGHGASARRTARRSAARHGSRRCRPSGRGHGGHEQPGQAGRWRRRASDRCAGQSGANVGGRVRSPDHAQARRTLRPTSGIRHDARPLADGRRRRSRSSGWASTCCPTSTSRRCPSRWSNPGSSPEQIETEITKKIEGAVNTISGIDELRSTSVEGRSQVTVTVPPREGRRRRGPGSPRQGQPRHSRRCPKRRSRPSSRSSIPDAAPVLQMVVSSAAPAPRADARSPTSRSSSRSRASAASARSRSSAAPPRRSRFASIRTRCSPTASR